MDNSTTEECGRPSTIQFWVKVAAIGMFVLVGLLLQLFIVSMNVADWLEKEKSMTATDQIITFIGIARIGCLMVYPLHFLTYSCSTQFNVIFSVLHTVGWIPSHFSSVWLSALLSTYFCLKISTFHHVFFLHLKAIISHRVVRLIVASVLLGFMYTLMHFTVFYRFLKTSKKLNLVKDTPNFNIMYNINCLWNTFPLLVFFASSIFLVISLSFHIRQMRSHGKVTISMDTYHRMIVFTAVSFLACALCEIVNLTAGYRIKLHGFVWMFVLWKIFPLLHSISLIYVTAKLRNHFIKIPHHGKLYTFKRKPPKAATNDLGEVTYL